MSDTSSENGENKRIRNQLTDKQRCLIEILCDQDKDAEEIRDHPLLRRQDGTRILMKTVREWIERYRTTGSTSVKPKSGRPRILNKHQETRLVNRLMKNPNEMYSEVKDSFRLKCTRKTVNNYGLRNGFRAFRPMKSKANSKPAKKPTRQSTRKSARNLEKRERKIEKKNEKDEKPALNASFKIRIM